LTPDLGQGSRLVVVGIDGGGTEVARLAVGHGDDPATLLAVHGWEVRRVRDVLSQPDELHVLTLTFLVEPVDPSRAERATVAPLVMGAPPRQDDDLEILEGEVALQHQRVAAYAVVTSTRGTLLTQFSDQTGAEGRWGLPGGGLEAGEAPERAVVREVWEESGQVIEMPRLALVRTSHWLGRAPTGRLEDFHAVRIVYRAVCLKPTDTVVHDIGGTTAAAAWVLPDDLGPVELTSGFASILHEVAGVEGLGSVWSGIVMATDEADGPDHHHDDPDADDRARPQP
jgi:ADP-ribose pyrophosphatase YjhB (NUDIX family)